jgi:ABC-2 type transport system ATP-binding protein
MAQRWTGSVLRRLRRPRWAALTTVVVLLVAAVVAGVVTRSPAIRTRAQFVAGTPEDGAAVRLDTTLYLPASTPAPAIRLAHGFGGSKVSVASQARSLAEHGYVVLAYTARGFGKSGGLIHLDAPAYEVADASLLVDHLAALPQVQKDAASDPRVGVAGSSYGGGLALMLAAYDHRIDAVGADITWNDLGQALFPNAAVDGAPGVFKKLWAGELFGTAAGSKPSACGRFAAALCAAYQQAAGTGEPDAAILALLRASSPASVIERIAAPTLLVQGEEDSLFPLGQAAANARGIAANGTPVKVIWRSGGHDGESSSSNFVHRVESWFDPLLLHDGHSDTSFVAYVPGESISTANSTTVSRLLEVEGGYTAGRTVAVALKGRASTVFAPAGGNPAAVTSVPGLGALLGQAATLTGATGLSSIKGQVASFRSAPLTARMRVIGSSTVDLAVTAQTSTDATLFVSLHDVAPDGTDTLPAQLVAPVRLTGLRPRVPTTVTVALPAIAAEIPAGHHLAVRVSTTDLGYQLPDQPRAYTVALAGGDVVHVATVDGHIARTGQPLVWLVSGLAAMALLAAGAVVATVRRRRRRVVQADLAGVPVAVEGLVKEYADGYRAVDGVSFRVERGQVVGLLGPNGAGKTTALRVLMGLIRPTAGSVRVFGELIVPGAPVLSRVGAFVEGPGLLPHLSGLDNLRLFWAATGQPTEDAELETALEIAGLGTSVERKVRTYSQGMRQRLAIAQAMLGLPELLVLDEPTNGLDPPQIAEMREVLRRYADTGRTVVVSSHLLAEVEQTCTHVVVMHKGRLVATGSVAEIARGGGGTQVAVDDPDQAVRVLAGAGIAARTVPVRRSLEDVFLELIGAEE